MPNISPHITFREATYSRTAEVAGIKNIPPPNIIKNMELVAAECFEKVRTGLGNRPIAVSSFYRSYELNAILPGASSTSQHIIGEAIDIDNDNSLAGPTNREIFDWLRANATFDQLIWEEGNDESPAWVHVSHSRNGNRREVLRSRKGKFTKLK